MLRLPDFPWDSLAPYRERAGAVSGSLPGGGIVDLSVGTPVDPTPVVVQDALRAAADAPGYPQTWGTPELREAVAGWFARRRGVPDVDPSRFRFSGDPMNARYCSNVMPDANRSGVTAL